MREALSTKIVFLLYEELLWAPEKERLIHPERFVMMFAPISRTFLRSYDIPDNASRASKISAESDYAPRVNLEGKSVLPSPSGRIFLKGDPLITIILLARAHYGDMGYVHHCKELFTKISTASNKLNLNGYISSQELRCFPAKWTPQLYYGKMPHWNRRFSFEELASSIFSGCLRRTVGKDCLSLFIFFFPPYVTVIITTVKGNPVINSPGNIPNIEATASDSTKFPPKIPDTSPLILLSPVEKTFLGTS